MKEEELLRIQKQVEDRVRKETAKAIFEDFSDFVDFRSKTFRELKKKWCEEEKIKKHGAATCTKK